MSGTNHRAHFVKEFERRYKAKKEHYDYIDFAYDLYRENLRLREKAGRVVQVYNKIMYGI